MIQKVFLILFIVDIDDLE